MSERVREGLGWAVRALLVFGGVAPFVPRWTEGIPGLAVLGRGLDAWFSLQCHRDEARSLVASAVCARCLGIYVGLALGALVARPALRPVRHVLWVLGAAAVLLADVLSEALRLRPAFAPLRFATGAAFAYPAAVSIVRALLKPARSERCA
jgi:uncharacterized membrane protein